MSRQASIPAGKLPGHLLDRLIRTHKTPPDASVIINAQYGFDAAAIRIDDETLLVKSDPITFATADAATYLVAVNANDIACLGGVPRWMTVVSLLPEGKTTVELVEKQFYDLQRACRLEGISLIGGHTEITMGLDRPLLIGTLLGTVGPYGLLEPGQAQAGDELFISWYGAIEGTAILATEKEAELKQALGADMVESAKALLTDPGISVSRDARMLLRTGAVVALHDATEGGVATAIHEIAGASGLGAEIDAAAIPFTPATLAICEYFGINPMGLISSGALLVAGRPGSEALLNTSLVPLAKIGVLTDDANHFTMRTADGVDELPSFDSDEITRAFA